MKHIPRATYRLQFNRGFTFRQATAVLEYLKALGVSDAYSSPWFTAGAESTHGYDVCCFGRINPAIGNAEDFEVFTTALRGHQLGLVLDIVPNHMSATSGNEWWCDVLEQGRTSRFASFFDIDWEPESPALRDKVLLPVLEDHYAKILECGKLRLEFRDGRFVISHHTNQFPIDPQTLPPEAIRSPQPFLATINGKPGEPESFNRLHELLQQQHYRLAYWKIASDEINYRRFFDVTALAAIRMDRTEVFSATHQLVLDLIAQGTVNGLRVDHPDGLRDPTRYFEQLQTAFRQLNSPLRSGSLRHHVNRETSIDSSVTPSNVATATMTEQELDAERLYVVAEKILCGDELLPGDWQIDGTTGYDFLNRVNGLFVDGRNEDELDRIYREFTGCPFDFKTLVHGSKKQMLETTLNSELNSLTRSLREVAASDRTGVDLSYRQLRRALRETIAAFPVYRTYISEEALEPSAADRAVIETAIAHAKTTHADIDPQALKFLEDILTLNTFHHLNEHTAALAKDFISRFQQLTGPVMAKGLEDTAFYNYNRLISLNEVGGDPRTFGTNPEAFHNHNVMIADRWPHSLVATATHDTKRGEDARVRINVLSELPREWEDKLRLWADLNANQKHQINNRPAPSRNDEYFLYQSLVGGWPADMGQPNALETFRERIVTFMIKAAREAKTNTSWIGPNEPYEKAIREFIENILPVSGDTPFLTDLKKFQQRVSFFARFNSLAQTVLKLTAPGVPDIYQGSELWDFSFVDPDNRRPVDYELRRQILSDLQRRMDMERNSSGSLLDLLRLDQRGEIKMFVIWKTLGLRQQIPETFDHGAYDPLPAFGACKDHVVAFARSDRDRQVITIVPRLVCELMGGQENPPVDESVWKDTFLPLANARSGGSFRNVFTGEIIRTTEETGTPAIRLADVLRDFPVAVMVSSDPH